MTLNPLRLRRLFFPALALSVAPVTAFAQACLGLHESSAVPTVEVVSNFHRDGITGPSTLGVSATSGALFGVIETGADVAAGQSAFGVNGLGLSAGVSRPLGRFASCLGGTIARSETAGLTPTSAGALFGAAAIKLPVVLGLNISAFGVASVESRTSSPDGAPSTTERGLAFRTGLSTYIRPWLGVRVFQDRFDDDHRFGFSLGLAYPLKRAERAERDADGDGVIDAQDKCPNTPAGTPVNAEGCPLDSDGDGVIDAQDKCPNTPRGTAVNAEGCPLDSDGDGVIDAQDKCPNTPRGTAVNAEGCPLDADGDGVVDAADACPNTPAGTAVDTRGCPKLFANAASFALTGVTFETSKAVIRPSSFAKLDEVAEALKANPDVRVEISGHTDNVGPDAANLRLSQARAESVRRYFIEKGVPADRMEARGYGETRPVATNGTADGRSANRRVEMSRLP